MAPKRYSIYASETLDRVLGDRVSGDDDGRSRSSLISAIADRYSEIVRRSMPNLSVPEWCAIFDVLNGCWMHDGAAMAAQGIAHQIADASSMDGLGEKWGIDAMSLAHRIADLPFASLVSVLDTAERFWTQGCHDGEEWAEIVSRLTR